MINTSETITFVDKLLSLEKAYHGLTGVARFDKNMASCRDNVKLQLAELILSDELEAEINTIKDKSMEKALAGQTVNEICNDVFGSEDYKCT